MKPNQLVYLKKALKYEKEKILRINELLQNESVIEFLKLKGIDNQLLFIDEWEILKKILEDYEFNQTNGVYVCIGAFYEDCNICYQETNYHICSTDIFSKLAEYRVYKDIESGVVRKAFLNKNSMENFLVLSKQFEQENIVLNPYGTSKNKNGYEEVRETFFVEAIKNGQPKAKQFILNKYNRM